MSAKKLPIATNYKGTVKPNRPAEPVTTDTAKLSAAFNQGAATAGVGRTIPTQVRRKV